jgi:hypothetical protein
MIEEKLMSDINWTEILEKIDHPDYNITGVIRAKIGDFSFGEKIHNSLRTDLQAVIDFLNVVLPGYTFVVSNIIRKFDKDFHASVWSPVEYRQIPQAVDPVAHFDYEDAGHNNPNLAIVKAAILHLVKKENLDVSDHSSH